MLTYYNNSKGLIKTQANKPHFWINAECPDVEEKVYLLHQIKIPEAFYNDIEDIDERPRIEVEDGWYLIILRIPFKSNDDKLPFNTAPLGLIFKGDLFVSISFYPTEILSDFVLYTQRKNISISNHFDLVMKLHLSSSVWFLKYLKQINQKIQIAEANLERTIKNEDFHSLLQIEKCLVFFIHSLKGNDILFHRIRNIKKEKEYYDSDLIEDVGIELRQAQETTVIYSNILNGMMDGYGSVISNNLNIIMKRLTSISIILMIPTIIASLYGMNVPNGLENNPFGFWIAVSISLIFSITGMLLLKMRKIF